MSQGGMEGETKGVREGNKEFEGKKEEREGRKREWVE